MCVIMGMRTGSTRFRTCVGIGSSLQLFVCMPAIKLVTLSAERGAKFQKVGTFDASGMKIGVPVKFSHILSIFDTK